jgi:D-3-phosphoglycerate dehydrogenase
MFNIQTLNTISSSGLNQFSTELYNVSSDCKNPDAILLRSHSLHGVSLPDTVKVIGRAGAGVNNIPVAELTQRGIPVFNTPGANANAVRELVLAGMLLASRHLCQAWDYVRHLKGNNTEIDQEVEKNKKQFVGFELMGKTLGVIGLGNIGVKVANLAIELGMNVIGYDPTITVNRAWELSSAVKQASSLDDLLMQSDFVSFHVPLTEETKNMMHAEKLKAVKKGTVLLNFSREGIIDNQALLKALEEHHVSAYVTDFPSAELKNHPSVISLPHLGASTKEAEENCAVMIVKQVKEFLENGTITYSVNFPSIEMPRNPGVFRLAIANNNVPNMVAQMSTKLATAGLNIISLLNKSRDSIAFTLIDVDQDLPHDLLQEIGRIQGVVQVRKL